jgi:hypothetical protein
VERELAATHAGGRPLIVIHLSVPDASRASTRRIVHVLRKSDVEYDLDRDGLLIALPRTGPMMAGELAADISEALRSSPTAGRTASARPQA